MDKITHKVRCEQWTSIIKECPASGMPKTTWCREHGISDKSFFYWQRILREEAYLGHKSPTETFYYYHQVEGAFKTLKQRDDISKRVIPEVKEYE